MKTDKLFPKNMHRAEQIVRIFLGTSLILLAYFETIGPWGYLGILTLYTGFVNSCPAYVVLGISTNKNSKKE